MRTVMPICLAALTPLINLPNQAHASEISVGDKKVQVIDSFARLEDWFGKPAIEVYFFSRQLTEDQKENIASKRYPNNSDFDKIAESNYPVMQLLLFFKKGTQTCSGDSLLSYTAVFQKNKNFPIDITTGGPVNWTFTHANNTLSEIGITKLVGSFAHGGVIDVQVKKQWLAEGADAKTILPAGQSSLLFSWDINAKTKVIVPSEVKYSAKPLIITSDMIKDSSISWVSKYHMLSIRLFKRELTTDERKAAASYPPKMPYNDFLGDISAYYKSEPASFSGEKLDRIMVNIMTKEGATSFHEHTYYANPASFQISGTPKLASQVTVRSKDSGMADSRTDQPAANWDINVSGILQQVH